MKENTTKTEEEKFEENISSLRKEFEINKKGTNKRIENVLLDIKQEKNGLTITETLKKNKEKAMTGILILILIILGIFGEPEYAGIYYFGFVFFIFGFFIGICEAGPGIIFLFSHGGTGLAIMLGSKLYPIFQSPILTDMPIKLIIVLILILSISIVSFILIVLFNVTNKFRTHKEYIPLTLSLFTLALLISTFIPRLIVPGVFH